MKPIRTALTTIVTMTMLATASNAEPRRPIDKTDVIRQERILTDVMSREKDDTLVLSTAERMRRMAQETCDRYRYYKSYAYVIWHYNSQYKLYTAQNWVRKLTEDANRNDDIYGHCFANWAIGDIYRLRHNYEIANEYYDHAIREAKTTDEMSVALIYISKCMTMSSRDPKLYSDLSEAYRYSRNLNDSMSVAMRFAVNYGRRGDRTNFEKWRHTLSELQQQAGGRISNDTEIFTYEPFDVYSNEQCEVTLRIYDYAINHQIDKANVAMDSLGSDIGRTFVRIATCRLTGDTIGEYKAQLRLAYLNDSLASLQARVGLEEMAMQYELDQLLNDKMRQEVHLYHITITALAVGAVLLILGLSLYVWNRNRALAQRETLMQSLEQANAIQKSFLHNMSHEVRTPLNAICGFATLLGDPEISKQVTDEEKSNMCKQIQSNTDLLLTLVNDILEIADLQSGKYKLNITECDAIDICQVAMADVQMRVPNGVELKFENTIGESCMMQTDANRVKQILLNFLTNACKHTNEGCIILSTRAIGNYIEFAVTDTGEGVDPDKADLIFERFEKLDNFKQGTGLGLAICRGIAELLNGAVMLDPSYLGGARFVCRLPLRHKTEPDYAAYADAERL